MAVLDRGEITDKGSINQRLMLARWQTLIEDIYRDSPSALVVRIDLSDRAQDDGAG